MELGRFLCLILVLVGDPAIRNNALNGYSGCPDALIARF